jgi:hypothetical protein
MPSKRILFDKDESYLKVRQSSDVCLIFSNVLVLDTSKGFQQSNSFIEVHN